MTARPQPDARPAPSAYTVEVDRVARLLMQEWERCEGKPVNASYVATFADMARVVIADRQFTPEQPDADPLAEALPCMYRCLDRGLGNVHTAACPAAHRSRVRAYVAAVEGRAQCAEDLIDQMTGSQQFYSRLTEAEDRANRAVAERARYRAQLAAVAEQVRYLNDEADQWRESGGDAGPVFSTTLRAIATRLRNALADPDAALARRDAKTLRDAADGMSNPYTRMLLYDRADAIEAQPAERDPEPRHYDAPPPTFSMWAPEPWELR